MTLTEQDKKYIIEEVFGFDSNTNNFDDENLAYDATICVPKGIKAIETLIAKRVEEAESCLCEKCGQDSYVGIRFHHMLTGICWFCESCYMQIVEDEQEVVAHELRVFGGEYGVPSHQILFRKSEH